MTPRLPESISSVEDVQEINGKGPWQSKSGGELSVLFNIPLSVLKSEFFQYNTDDLSSIPEDIRGLRSYKVENIPKGTLGANEWHTLRHELVFAIEGTFRWICEDLNGKKRVTTLDEQTGIWVRPNILHTYEALTHQAGLLVIANTLFMPDNPETHDTYSAESFRTLQSDLVSTQK